MSEWITTSEAARELGMSKSTLKRFCERNELVVVRTPGGHRRIDRLKLIAACQESGICSRRRRAGRPSILDCVDYLRDANASSLVSRLHEASSDLPEIPELMEETLVPALWRVGDLWMQGQLTVAEGKVCIATALTVIDAFIARAPQPNVALTIVGGSFTESRDTVASKLIMLAFRCHNINAIDLGADCLPEFMAQAQQQYNARAIWVSHTHVVDSARVVADHRLLSSLVGPDIPIYYGGGGVSPSLARQLEGSIYVETILDLVARFSSVPV